PAIEVGGAPELISRNVWPRSTDPSQTLRCVPVPVGPLTKTRPWGSIAMSGSPFVWMGSTTAGTSNLIGGRVELELEVCASKGKLQALSSSAQLEAKARARRTRTLWTLMLTSLS